MIDAVIRARFDALDLAGHPTPHIAHALGVSERTVKRWRADADRKRKPATIRRPEADRARAADLIADGCSMSEAARTIGVDERTVARWFPNAPRWSRQERGQASVMARLERELFGTTRRTP